ncbi:MAG: chemotaxis protein CheW [Polyangiales bacterium]
MRSSSRAYAAGASKNLIRVAVGPVMYALKVSRIREIVNPLPIIELPREREFVLGVADYREEVVVVVDLRSLFGLEYQAPTRKSKWIILESDHRLVGIVVDSVLDVFSSSAQPERAVPALDERHEQRGIRSAYKHGNELVFLLDADRLAEPAMRLERDEISLLPSEAP